jgi:hypothetical protein
MPPFWYEGRCPRPHPRPCGLHRTLWLSTVADDSSLRQAKILELKGKAGLSRSNTKPDTETSHTPTTQDNSGAFQAIIPLFKVREELLSHWGVEMRVKRTS